MRCDQCKKDVVNFYTDGDRNLCKKCFAPGTVHKRSPSRRNLLAFALSVDIADIEEYQAGHHRPPLYQNDGSDEIYIVLKGSEKPPMDQIWKKVSDFADEYGAKHNARILYSTGEMAE
jgi:hypothetical protein